MPSLNGVDISNIEDGNIKLYDALRGIDANAKLNALNGVTAGTLTASSPIVVDANKRVNGIAITEAVTVDASDGGTGKTTNLTLVPANSIILNVTAVVNTPFDGDTTTTLEVGIATNADAYIDTVDFDPSAAANTYASSLNGTTNDVVAPEYVATAKQLIATWTNTANMTAGEVTVYTTFIKL